MIDGSLQGKRTNQNVSRQKAFLFVSCDRRVCPGNTNTKMEAYLLCTFFLASPYVISTWTD